MNGMIKKKLGTRGTTQECKVSFVEGDSGRFLCRIGTVMMVVDDEKGDHKKRVTSYPFSKYYV